MSDISISAESISADTVCCDLCSRTATRVELNAWLHHDSNRQRVLCETCSQGPAYEQCSCCEMSDPLECQNDNNGAIIYLMPVYPAGGLNEMGGYCCEHP